jgi:hypothetical protein
VREYCTSVVRSLPALALLAALAIAELAMEAVSIAPAQISASRERVGESLVIKSPF